MKRIGKKTKEWLKVKERFLKGKQNHEGYYICEDKGEWTKYPEVDHKLQRSTHPSLVFDEENLQILCHTCHSKKHP